MVAIVSGNSLGLSLTSLATLGQRGVFGSGTTGRDGGLVFVNAANGNLVLQSRDDLLAGRGRDAASVRTYNSQGQLTDDNGDNWSNGIFLQQLQLNGTRNTAGSTLVRTDRDGAQAVYTYDVAAGHYVSTAGAGAFDTIAYDGTNDQFAWTDGSTGEVEHYDASTGRLLTAVDTSGNTLSYGYDGAGRLTRMTTAGGETVYLDYVGSNISQLRVVRESATGTETLTTTRYTYDAQNRLASVIVDLSPEDGSVADGQVYVTSYTYDGASDRVATVSQTDGTRLAITYVQVGGEYRVETLTNAAGEVTSFSYDVANRRTTVTDPLQLRTVYAYDAGGQLLSVTAPAVDGVSQVTSYAYDAAGNLTAVTDPAGRTVAMGYDAHGNLTTQRDAAGNTVTRTYDAHNQLATETVYAVPDSDGAGPAQPGAPATSRFVYDAAGRNQLRFAISATGDVTEYRYDAQGNQIETLQYGYAPFDIATLGATAVPSESDMEYWAREQDPSRTGHVARTFDFRGQVTQERSFAVADENGNVDALPVTVHYVYDSTGRLLNSIAANGGITSYTYDGLGRVQTATDAANAITVNRYDDVNRRSSVTIASGLVTTSTYDAAGRLLTVVQGSDAGGQLGETRYRYDADGRLLMSTDPTGVSRWSLYDDAGRKVGDVDADGTLTEYVYLANNLLAGTIVHATRVNTALLANAGEPLHPTLAAIRPAANAGDQREWRVYDNANRLVQVIDGLGYVTQTTYDGASHALSVTRYATHITVPATGLTPITAPVAVTANAAADRVTRSFYDADGRVIGELDAENYYTHYEYDAAGRVVAKTRYASPMVGTLTDARTPPQLVAEGAPAPAGAYVRLRTTTNPSLPANVGNGTAGATDAASLLARLQAFKAADPAGAFRDLVSLVRNAHVTLLNAGFNGVALLRQWIAELPQGSPMFATIAALGVQTDNGVFMLAGSGQPGDNNALMIGSAGLEELYGDSGNDTLSGADYMDGGAGSDVYLFGRGDGHVTVEGEVGEDGIARDVIQLRPGITKADIELSGSARFLKITLVATGDRLEAEGEMREIRFADGSVWTAADIEQRLAIGGSQDGGYYSSEPEGSRGVLLRGQDGEDNLGGSDGYDTIVGGRGNDYLLGMRGQDLILGGDGDDELYGGDGQMWGSWDGYGENDTLDGGAGDDILNGGFGTDTYVFGIGSGHDTIKGMHPFVQLDRFQNADTLNLKDGIAPEDLILTRSNDDLVISLRQSADSVRVERYFADLEVEDDWYGGFAKGLEYIDFADGTRWEAKDIQLHIDTPYVVGLPNSDDLLVGTDGADVLIGRSGRDTLVGGAGNDTLSGNMDGDTFVFGLGSDVDVINGGYDDLLQLGVPHDWSDLQIRRVDDGIEIRISQRDVVLLRRSVDVQFSDGVMMYASDLDQLASTSEQSDTAAFYNGGTPIDGKGGNDSLTGGWGADTMVGGYGRDTLDGGYGNDTLSGGKQRDLLIGGDGADVYRFARGDGADTIDNASWDAYSQSNTNDQLEFGPDIQPEDLRLTRNGADLVLSLVGSDDQVTLLNYFNYESAGQPDYRLGAIKFANGSSWSRADVAQRLATPPATPATTVVAGTAGADVFTFQAGSGSVRITGFDGTDEIHFGAGIDSEQLQAIRNGDDLVLYVAYTADRLEVPGYFALHANDPSLNVRQEIFFADGYGLVFPQVDWLTRRTTDGDDRFVSQLPNGDWMDGGEGDDTLIGGAFDDFLIGGRGDDLLDGGAGNDVYRFGWGDGRDTIVAGGAASGDVDVVEFGNDVRPSDLKLAVRGRAIVVSLKTSDDQLVIESALPGGVQGPLQIQEFRFADGSIWDLATILAQATSGTNQDGKIEGFDFADTLIGGNRDDRLFGFGGNDLILGGIGNDQIDGGDGDDTIDGGNGDDTIIASAGTDVYRLGHGSGRDRIDRFDGTPGQEIVEIAAGIKPTDVIILRDEYDEYEVRIISTGDRISFGDVMPTEIRFADGTVWDQAAMADEIAQHGAWGLNQPQQVRVQPDGLRDIGPVLTAPAEGGPQLLFRQDGDTLEIVGSDEATTRIDGWYASQATHVDQFVVNGTSLMTAPVSPAATVQGRDQTTHLIYDALGRLVGEVDAENYLTEHVYNDAGQRTNTIRYSQRVPVEVKGDETVLDLRPSGDWLARSTSTEYDLLGRVTREANADGLITSYVYDEVGRLVSTRSGEFSNDLRVGNARYDLQGRLIGELSGEGSALLETGEPLSSEAIQAVWDQYGITHTYDAAGRRTSTTDANGNRTLFYYDADGRQRYSVNAEGEVQEQRYNALNQLEKTVLLANRLPAGSLAGLHGGVVDHAVEQLVEGQYDLARDTVTGYAYTVRGQLQTTTDALSHTATTDYNAFGEAEHATAVDGLETTLERDRRGQVTSTVTDPAGEHLTTKAQYDAFGRLVRSEDASGKVSAQVFDRLGRVVQTIDPSVARRSTTWDAFDRKLTQTDALGNTTTFSYNDFARWITMTTPEGVSMVTGRNVHGETWAVIDADGNQTEYQYDHDGRLINTIDALQGETKSHYDAGGRLAWTEDAEGLRTAFTYDGANRVLTRTVDPQGLALTTTYGYDAKGQTISVEDPNGTITTTEYDVVGRVLKQIVDPTGLHIQTSFTYDEAGRTLTVVDANQVTTSYGYDSVGRRTSEVRDPGGLNIAKTYSYDKSGNVLATQIANATTGQVRAVKTVYDVLNRPVLVTDPAGGLTYYEYDAEGRVLRSTQLAQAVDVTTMPALNASTAVAYAANLLQPGKDRVVANRYDRDGRLRFSVDGTGAVVELRYDARGNVQQRTAYATRIDVSAWDGKSDPQVTSDDADRITRSSYDALNRVVYSADALNVVTSFEYDKVGRVERQTVHALPVGESSTLIPANSAQDRSTVFSYDKAGRVTQVTDPIGAITRNVYDNNGNLIEQTKLAWTDPTWTVSDMYDLVPGEDRTTRTQYDAANRAVYVTDAAGYVTTTVYDDLGRVSSTTRWANKPTVVGDLPTASPGVDQTTRFTYDAAGRLLTSTDAAGKAESYTYNAFSDKVSFTNKKGSTWNYEYDGAGRMTREISPEVTVTAVTLDAHNDLVEGATDTQRLITVLGYDALGNLTSRTEALGRAEQRTTQYRYDAMGRQIRVIYPNAPIYEESPNEALFNGIAGAAERKEETRALQTTTEYDAFGNAVSNVDVAGNKSYKFYDKANRVIFDIDAMGYVTRYGRDGFGDANTVSRFAQSIDTGGSGLPPTDESGLSTDESGHPWPAGVPLTVANLEGWLNGVASRTVTTVYDKLGRAVKVSEKAAFVVREETYGTPSTDVFGKTTYNTYDGFGNLVRVRQQRSDDRYDHISSFQYFDVLGRVTEQIDVAGNRTTTTYDAFGNVATKMEWAGDYRGYVPGGPFSHDYYDGQASVDDRKVVYTYDVLNRKISETRKDVVFSDAIEGRLGQSHRGDIETKYGYDAVGNLTVTTDALGGKTYSYYDALGRVTAVAAPSRATAVGASTTLTPVTLFRRDAYGNVVVTVELRNGALGVVEESTEVSNGVQLARLVGSFSTEDGQTFASYDLHGHVLQTTDAERHSTFTSYNERGQVAKTWHGVTSGARRYESGVDEDGNGGGKMIEDSTVFKLYEYDKLGQLVRTYDPGPLNKLSGTGMPGMNGGVTETTITESTTVGWGESNPSDEDGPTQVKEIVGSNSVRVSWVDLGDPALGDVRVQIDYLTSTDDGHSPVDRSYAQVFATGDAYRTVTLNWNDGDPNGPHGISAVKAVRVQQMVNGAWATVWDSNTVDTPSGAEGSYTTGVAYRTLTQTDLSYNAYGELVRKGLDGGAQEYFDYDAAGRLWRTNSGDGVDKIYLYDSLGHAISELRSDGSGGQDIDVRTVASAEDAYAMGNALRSTKTEYDYLGRVFSTREAQRAVAAEIPKVNGRTDTASGAITGSAAVVASNESGETNWAGRNSVSVSWPDISHLGTGDIKVELVYTTAVREARPGMMNESDYVGGYTPAEVRSIDAVFSAEQAGSGATLSWVDDGPAAEGSEGTGGVHFYAGGIGSVNAVRVYKRDRWGDWELVDDSAAGPKKVLDVGRVADTSLSPSLQIRPIGGSEDDWQYFDGPSQNFSQIERHDMSSLGSDGYEFRLMAHVEQEDIVLTSGFVHPDGTSETTFVREGFFVRPTVLQRHDRWGNTTAVSDARNRNWETTYEYNAYNQVIAEHKPSNDDGASIGPTTEIFYDALGRQVAVRDANGNLNTQVYDAGGNLLEEHHADGGVVKHTYDAFGNKIRTVNAEGNREGLDLSKERDRTTVALNTTDYKYDKMHRLLETRHESVTVAQAVDSSDPDAAMQVHSQVVTLVDRNEYDQAGRRLTQIVGSYAGNAGEMTRYKFDLADRVIETIQPGGGEFRTRAVYDKQGRKIAEVDQNGNASTWNYDYFGLLMSRTDLSDNEYRFSYDHARQLTTTINERYSDSAAQLINTYNTAGQLTKIKDVALNQTTEYWYDLSGQHVREKTTQNGTAYQDNLMAYDELGRLRHVSDGRMSIDIAYDAVGNRVNLRTHTNVPTMADPTVDVPKDSDLWFTYDSMNRQTGADLQRFRDIDGNWAYGFYTKLNGIEIIPGVSGHRITYDLNGNRASDTYLGTKVRLVGGTAPTYYEEDGQLYELTPGTDPRYEVQPMPMSWEVVETYSYDGLGRLTGALRDGVAIDQRLYDQAGRVVVQGPQNLPKSYAEAINKNVAPGDAYGQEYRINRYDSNGRLMRQQSLDSEQRAITSDTQYTTYDKAGNVVSYKVTVPGQYTNTYTFTRERFDGYKEKSNRATSTRFESGQTDSHYDVNGNLIRIDDQKKNENDRNFVNDLTGHALFVQQGDAVQRQVVVNGEVLGRYGVGLNEKTPRDKDGNPIFTELADFSSYQPITGSYPSASVGSYQVRNGDTLRSIARQSYGDEGLWYRIAETNGLSGDRDLRVGQTITIPSAVGSIRNNAGTFQPYDPSKITGDTSPYMPTPHAGGGGCGGIGMLLVIVVAAVVTVFTAGAAALAMAGTLSATTSVGAIATAGAAAMTSGTLAGAAAAAIGAAVGSIVSQGVAMAVGLQDKFSWKQVGMSAIGGAVSAALPPGAFPTIGGSPAATLAVRGAVNNAITQGIGVATGLQDSFNWRGVAAAGASAFVTGKLAGSVMGSQEGTGLVGALGGDEAAVVAGRTVLGIAGGLTSALVRGGKISIGKIAVDAFGNALGDGVVESMRAEPQGRGPWSEFGYQNGSDIQSEQAPGLRRQAQEQAALVETFKSAAASFNPDDYAKGPLVAGPGGATRVDELSRNVRELTALSKAVVASTPATAQMAPGSYDGPGGRLELSSIPGGRSDSIDAAITARLNRESVIRETVVRNDPTLIEAERIAADEPPRIEPVDSGISAAEMASRFGQGVVGAAKAVTIEPVLQVRDMGLALLSVGYNEIWRSGDEPRWYPEMKSGVAEAYEHGVSQAKLVLQSNPITGVGVLTHDLTTAGMNRDWGSVAELSGGVAGGFVIGKATANYGGYGVRWAPGDIGRSPLPSQRGASSLLNFDIVKPNSTPAWVKESPNYVEGLPFTYKAKPFQNFVNRFHEEFAAAGFDDVEGFMQGSSASGIKFRTQQRLDARNGLTPSDYDVAIVSPKLLQAAREQGLNVLNGPLNEKQLGALGLIEAQNSLQAASKGQLPVNFMVYESAQAVLKAQKTIPFSDWRK